MLWKVRTRAHIHLYIYKIYICCGSMRIRTMLNYMRGYYTLIYFHIHNICARICTLMDKIFAYPQYMCVCVCVQLQCKYCAGVLCCYMLYNVQCTLNSLYIYIYTYI